MKNDQKNPFYPSVLVSCMFKQINLLFNAEQDKALKGPHMNLEFESLIQNSPNPSGLSYISPIHPFCHVSCMHHIVALCLVLIVLRCVHRGRFCLQGYSRVSN